MATWGRSAAFVRRWWARWRCRSLRHAACAARLALGERMNAAGIDDGQLGAQIAGVDEKMRQAQATGGSTGALKSERRKLLMRLAACALEEDAPLPGADVEYERAREALASLEKQVTALATAGAAARQDTVGRRRAAVGYGLLACICLLALLVAGWTW